MLTTVEAIYENGQIIWEETPPTTKRSKVIVTFLEEPVQQPIGDKEKKKRIAGSLKGKIHVPEDFNEPLDDLKDYM